MGAKKTSGNRPPRRKKGRGNSGTVWLVGGLVGLGLLLAVGAVVWIISLRKSDKERLEAENAPTKALLRYAPDRPSSLYSAAVARTLANPHYQQLRGKQQASFEWQPHYMNVSKEKVERYVSCGNRDHDTTVLFLTEPMTAADVRQKNTYTGIANSWSEEKIGDHTLYVHTSAFKIHIQGVPGDGGRDPTCFFMPNDKTIVCGVADDLRPVMERRGKPPELTPGFEAAFATVDLEKPFVTVNDTGDFPVPLFSDAPYPIEIRIHPGKLIKGVSKVVQTEYGPEVVSTATYVCKDAAEAQYLKTTLEEGRERALKPLGPDARELFKNQTLALNGNTLTVRTSQSIAAVLAWLEKRRDPIVAN